MIDQALVDSNILSLRNSIKNKKDIGLDYAYVLSDIFSSELIEKIKEEFDTNTTWENVQHQETRPRKSMPWKPESVIEEVHMVFQALEEEISEISGQNLKFSSVNFWQDLPGYTIVPHVDNNRITVAIQVYINVADLAAGTEMYKDGNMFYKLPWISNTGYVLKNVPTSVHGMTMPVDTLRQHLYAIYK
jgi:hypothetical protein